MCSFKLIIYFLLFIIVFTLLIFYQYSDSYFPRIDRIHFSKIEETFDLQQTFLNRTITKSSQIKDIRKMRNHYSIKNVGQFMILQIYFKIDTLSFLGFNLEYDTKIIIRANVRTNIIIPYAQYVPSSS